MPRFSTHAFEDDESFARAEMEDERFEHDRALADFDRSLDAADRQADRDAKAYEARIVEAQEVANKLRSMLDEAVELLDHVPFHSYRRWHQHDDRVAQRTLLDWQEERDALLARAAEAQG